MDILLLLKVLWLEQKVNGTVLFTNSQRTKDIPSNNQFYRGESEQKIDFG